MGRFHRQLWESTGGQQCNEGCLPGEREAAANSYHSGYAQPSANRKGHPLWSPCPLRSATQDTRPADQHASHHSPQCPAERK